jgi:hypothetical protein
VASLRKNCRGSIGFTARVTPRTEARPLEARDPRTFGALYTLLSESSGRRVIFLADGLFSYTPPDEAYFFLTAACFS